MGGLDEGSSEGQGQPITGYRRPSESELRLLGALLTAAFPGKDQLLAQLSRAEVQPIDGDGSLAIRVIEGPAASVLRRVPVEAVIEDEDGVLIHVLLHVLNGYLNEFEVFREDSAPVRGQIRAEEIRILVL